MFEVRIERLLRELPGASRRDGLMISHGTRYPAVVAWRTEIPTTIV